MSLTQQIDSILSDSRKDFKITFDVVEKLPHSQCRNCNEDLRLFKGHWFHIFMSGNEYFRSCVNKCKHALPLRCKECNGRINYKTTTPSYYDFLCEPCIRKYHGEENNIGNITKKLRKQLDSATHPYLKYGTVCSVVLTKTGIYLGDIA